MAGPLTEVAVGLRLPESPLTPLFGDDPHARLVLLPIHTPGRSPPEQYLVSVHKMDSDPDLTEAALAVFLDDVQAKPTDTPGVRTYTARLKDAVCGRIEEGLATALEGVQGHVIHRPVVITAERAYCSFVTTEAGPLEQGLKQLVETLRSDGLQAQVLRIGPHRPPHSPGTYEEGLTQKQAEFLRVALALGLYDTPRRITLESVASMFGISKAAAHNRMRSAERKVLQHYFGM